MSDCNELHRLRRIIMVVRIDEDIRASAMADLDSIAEDLEIAAAVRDADKQGLEVIRQELRGQRRRWRVGTWIAGKAVIGYGPTLPKALEAYRKETT